MKYYVVSDLHGFYDEFIFALTEKGYFDDSSPKKIIVCGDLFDRGNKPKELQSFICDLIDKNQVVLVKGNHEDLAEEFVLNYNKYLNTTMCFSHHYHNGLVDTISNLLDLTYQEMIEYKKRTVDLLKNTPFFTKIIPSMVSYYETENYIFTHGYIPCKYLGWDGNTDLYSYDKDWRNSDEKGFYDSRRINGMLANSQGVKEPNKTIVCGHWNVSYGHAVINKNGEERGENAIHTPYYADGIIAIDAFTKISNKVNCIVVED